jgi:hypothetical protein
MFINDTIKTATLALTVAAPGAIATAPLSVDIASSFNINYTGAANGLVTIPNPTDGQAGDRIIVANTGTIAFSLGGDSINPGAHTLLHWTGTAWSIFDGGRNAGASISVATVPAGALLVTHNFAMPVGSFSSVVCRAFNSAGNEVMFRRNKAGDTANALAFTVPAAITTNLPIVFDISPLA